MYLLIVVVYMYLSLILEQLRAPHDLTIQRGPNLMIKWKYYTYYNMGAISFTVHCQSNRSYTEVHVSGNAMQVNLSTGLMHNSVYNCCVYAAMYEREVVSESVCQTVNTTSKCYITYKKNISMIHMLIFHMQIFHMLIF